MVKTSGSGQVPRIQKADDWTASFQDVEFSWSDETPDEHWASVGPLAAEPDDEPPKAVPPPITRRMRRARRARRRVVIASMVAAVLVACGAAGAVALVRRDGRTESGSPDPTTATGERTATTVTATTAAPTTAAPTTVAPTTAAPTTVPPTAAPAPGAFTVRATCGGRACTVAVRRSSTTSAARVGSLRTGQVVQVSCSTHGEPVTDGDTGERSDVWYRLTDTGRYASALYLEGPTVPDCA